MPDAAVRPSTAPVLVIGEALVDVVRRGGEEVAHPGGSPMNVAVGLARLGVPALLHTSLAADDDGRRVLDHLAANDVPLTATSVARQAGAATSRAVATIGPDGAAAYDFSIAWDVADLPGDAAVAQARALHVGSISAFLSPGDRVVGDAVRAAAEAGVPVSLDPNARPALLGDAADVWRRVCDLATSCTVVKLSDEDADYLQPGRDPVEVLGDLRALGVAVTVLTRGQDGLVGRIRGTSDSVDDVVVEVDGAAVTVADTIGAGDTVSASLIALLLERGLPRDAEALRALLEAAAEAAGVTVSRPGADPPRRSELGARWA